MVSIIAVWFDIRTYRVSNKFNLMICICGILYSCIFYGLIGLRGSLMGMLLPIVGLFILFAFGVLGAGDIKLFAALGTIAHGDIVWIVGFSFLLAAIWGVGLITCRGIKSIMNRTKIHFTIPVMLSTLVYALANI